MPYRRLPNTDQARLRALQKAAEQSERCAKDDMPISFKALHEAKMFLNDFEKTLSQYKSALDKQVSTGKNAQHVVKNLRLYISHFIQVLNLAVIRGEIKKEHKRFYNLDEDNYAVPELATESALLLWGKNLIDGEAERQRVNGAPMYNPSIAKLKVHFDIFREYKINQKILQQNTSRYLESVSQLRQKGDNIIQEIWNQVEAKFAKLPPDERLQKCESFGLIYYYRQNEK